MNWPLVASRAMAAPLQLRYSAVENCQYALWVGHGSVPGGSGKAALLSGNWGWAKYGIFRVYQHIFKQDTGGDRTVYTET